MTTKQGRIDGAAQTGTSKSLRRSGFPPDALLDHHGRPPSVAHLAHGQTNACRQPPAREHSADPSPGTAARNGGREMRERRHAMSSTVAAPDGGQTFQEIIFKGAHRVPAPQAWASPRNDSGSAVFQPPEYERARPSGPRALPPRPRRDVDAGLATHGPDSLPRDSDLLRNPDDREQRRAGIRAGRPEMRTRDTHAYNAGRRRIEDWIADVSANSTRRIRPRADSEALIEVLANVASEPEQAFIMGMLHADRFEAAQMLEQWDVLARLHATVKVDDLIAICVMAPELKALMHELKKGLDSREPVDLRIASMPKPTSVLQRALIAYLPRSEDKELAMRLFQRGYAGLSEQERRSLTRCIPRLHDAAAGLLRIGDMQDDLATLRARMTV